MRRLAAIVAAFCCCVPARAVPLDPSRAKALEDAKAALEDALGEQVRGPLATLLRESQAELGRLRSRTRIDEVDIVQADAGSTKRAFDAFAAMTAASAERDWTTAAGILLAAARILAGAESISPASLYGHPGEAAALSHRVGRARDLCMYASRLGEAVRQAEATGRYPFEPVGAAGMKAKALGIEIPRRLVRSLEQATGLLADHGRFERTLAELGRPF